MNRYAEEYGKLLACNLRNDPFQLPFVLGALIQGQEVIAKSPEFEDAALLATILFDEYQREAVHAYVREMLQPQ